MVGFFPARHARGISPGLTFRCERRIKRESERGGGSAKNGRETKGGIVERNNGSVGTWASYTLNSKCVYHKKGKKLEIPT